MIIPKNVEYALVLFSVLEISTITFALITEYWFLVQDFDLGINAICNIYKCDYYKKEEKYRTENWKNMFLLVPLCIALIFAVGRLINILIGKLVNIIGVAISVVNSLLLSLTAYKACTIMTDIKNFVIIEPVVYLILGITFLNYGAIILHSRNILGDIADNCVKKVKGEEV